jgi:ferredoxin
MAMAPARELADVILAAHGATNRLVDLGEDDPDAVADALAIDAETPPAWRAPTLGTIGTRREICRTILRTLRVVAEVTPDVVQVPGGSPYGEVILDRDRCTLCLACAGACPTGALIDTADRPALRFIERSCVQCGICVATCPEDALRLSPRLLLTDKAGEPRELASEEPFACRSCGKPFGTRSSIERVKARLHGNSHYADPARLALVELCGDCRVIRLLDQREPLAAKPRPLPRKSEDYLASE